MGGWVDGGVGGMCQSVSGMAQWPSSLGVIPYHPPNPQLDGSCVGTGECILHSHNRGDVGDSVSKRVC